MDRRIARLEHVVASGQLTAERGAEGAGGSRPTAERSNGGRRSSNVQGRPAKLEDFEQLGE